ncbi:MAG: amino acid permease [Chitinophagaceae bacterium]|nr:MAG: amino acid permease [Chitinophagaceae bacterium]
MPLKNALKRSIKTPGAIMMGLGSILGTGLFVSLAIATQFAGNGIFIAIIIAAIVAILNGLSSAQLAANFPVSGGTYEYAYSVLGSYWGFTAGWMFLIAKSASAATAVLGCTGYIFYLFDIQTSKWVLAGAGLLILFSISALVSGGIKRTNTANVLIVSFTLFGLLALVLGGVYSQGVPVKPIQNMFDDLAYSSVVYASALMFVAYTGYGRIATLGEEVVNPKKTILKAIIMSMFFIVIIYLLVSLTAIQVMEPEAFGQTVEGRAAPLMIVAQTISLPGLGLIVSLAAITAMAGVLLNLILGLSRVMLGMARRRDLPAKLENVHPVSQSPVNSIWATTLIIAILVLSRDVVFTWSFSAFTVLIYYAITNLSALQLPKEKRLYSKWIPVLGLISCLTLAFWIEPSIWLSGLALILAGAVWHTVALMLKRRK